MDVACVIPDEGVARADRSAFQEGQAAELETTGTPTTTRLYEHGRIAGIPRANQKILQRRSRHIRSPKFQASTHTTADGKPDATQAISVGCCDLCRRSRCRERSSLARARCPRTRCGGTRLVAIGLARIPTLAQRLSPRHLTRHSLPWPGLSEFAVVPLLLHGWDQSGRTSLPMIMLPMSCAQPEDAGFAGLG